MVDIPCSLILSINNGEDEGGRGMGGVGGEGVFTQRSKSVKHDESYLPRIP